MALDLYVGTMTRFYRRDWENVVQRASREQGRQYTMIFAGGEPEAPPPAADEIRQAVAAWCEGMSRNLSAHGIAPISWDEGDDRPYFTDRPAWEGYRALLVWAAHAEHPDLPLPETIPTSWVDDPAYNKSVSEGFRSRYLSILKPEVWIPVDLPFVFEAPTLMAEQGCIGSVFALKRELDQLAEKTAGQFVADKKPVEVQPEVAERPGFFARLFGAKQQPARQPEPSLAEGAEFGLSIFRDLANKACEQRLPMMLNF